MLPNLLLPLLSVALGLAAPAPASPAADGGPSRPSPAAPVSIASPRTAAVELAVTLAEADAIHPIAARRDASVAITLDHDGESFEITATFIARGRHKGEVSSLSIIDLGPAAGGLGNLSWLGAELADATAIVKLAVDEDGAVTLTTDEGRAYMAIPGRGSGGGGEGGNAAVESRWAAAWDHSAG